MVNIPEDRELLDTLPASRIIKLIDNKACVMQSVRGLTVLRIPWDNTQTNGEDDDRCFSIDYVRVNRTAAAGGWAHYYTVLSCQRINEGMVEYSLHEDLLTTYGLQNIIVRGWIKRRHDVSVVQDPYPNFLSEPFQPTKPKKIINQPINFLSNGLGQDLPYGQKLIMGVTAYPGYCAGKVNDTPNKPLTASINVAPNGYTMLLPALLGVTSQNRDPVTQVPTSQSNTYDQTENIGIRLLTTDVHSYTQPNDNAPIMFNKNTTNVLFLDASSMTEEDKKGLSKMMESGNGEHIKYLYSVPELFIDMTQLETSNNKFSHTIPPNDDLGTYLKVITWNTNYYKNLRNRYRLKINETNILADGDTSGIHNNKTLYYGITFKFTSSSSGENQIFSVWDLTENDQTQISYIMFADIGPNGTTYARPTALRGSDFSKKALGFYGTIKGVPWASSSMGVYGQEGSDIARQSFALTREQTSLTRGDEKASENYNFRANELGQEMNTIDRSYQDNIQTSKAFDGTFKIVEAGGQAASSVSQFTQGGFKGIGGGIATLGEAGQKANQGVWEMSGQDQKNAKDHLDNQTALLKHQQDMYNTQHNNANRRYDLNQYDNQLSLYAATERNNYAVLGRPSMDMISELNVYCIMTKEQYTEEDLHHLDQFFDMYGYAVDEPLTDWSELIGYSKAGYPRPKANTGRRKNHNYFQLSECYVNVLSSIPENMQPTIAQRVEMENRLMAGIRVCHSVPNYENGDALYTFFYNNPIIEG